MHSKRLTPFFSLQRFTAANGGATALLFGLALIPAMLTIGAAIDFGRVALLKSSLQAAADAGVLAAGAQSKNTQSARASVAQGAVIANLGPKADGANVVVTETEPGAGVYQVKVDATLRTAVMKLAHIDTLSVSVKSEARNIGGSINPIEIALALDNTGSMHSDMPALKSAAKSLVQAVLGGGANSNIRVSVVPYVAAVNPGLTDMSLIDTKAVSPWAGNWFNYAWIALDATCTPNWGTGGGSSSGPGGSTSGDVSGDASDIIDILNPFRRIARELFGVSAALAADVTANTVPTLTLQNLTSSATGHIYKAPVGFGIQPKTAGSGGCDWLVNPGVVSAYELFDRLVDNTGKKGVAWKGCVEARATAQEIASINSSWGGAFSGGVDYDATDLAPSATNPASLFTPYFWPDEPDYSTTTGAAASPGAFVAGSGALHNNYLVDYTFPNSWGWTRNDWNNGQGILKYDRTTRAAIINEIGPDSYGPNAACPDALTRLTNNQAQLNAAIDHMNYWYNGGTIISEGLTWAWRSLSPEKPFADGKPYSDTTAKKVIVLMTDGVNGLADNGNTGGANISDYSAYGYLGASRLSWADGVSTYAELQTFLDNRLKLACDNAKAKGIKIYTVMFNHAGFLSGADQAHSTSLLQYCASQSDFAFLATDPTALQNSFNQIAASAAASPLHLTR